MPELRQEYLDILEKREWSVSGYTDDGRVELEWWSPAGEDFLVCVNVENFPDEILDYSDDFDPDEHIEMWVEARANGRQDVPGARRLAKDAEDIQKELRSYMLPWFSPFAAPWCGKIQRAFPKAYVTMNFELILVPRTNTYINLNHCSTPDEFKAEVIEGVSRFAFKAFTKPLCKEHLDGINKLLDTKFTPEDMEYIYTNLGNGINHELCMKFVKSGYDLKVIEGSV